MFMHGNGKMSCCVCVGLGLLTWMFRGSAKRHKLLSNTRLGGKVIK